jgi:hypothetical protein
MSYHMVGTQNFLLAVGMGESAKVTKMLRQLMPVTIAFINAQFAAGATSWSWPTTPLQSGGVYHHEQYLPPVHQRSHPRSADR